MTTTDFIKKAYEALNSKTKYGKGTFGQKATKSFLAQKAKQYPDFYTASKVNELAASGAYLYDCVGLIKGIIWGYPEKGKYKSGGLSDVSDQGLWDTYCINKSKDFSAIKPGAIVHIKGHVGIYVGDGFVIECTTKWSGNVLLSSIKKGEARYRNWTEYGYLKILEDKEDPKPSYSMDYIVKRGDTMYSIAKKHNMSLRELIALNPQIKIPSLIFPGDVIHIRK